MHSWIQNHILVELTKNVSHRYSELRPRDVEGNLFSYHLKGLMSEGLVQKHDDGYALSAKGMQFAGTFSLKTGRTRVQPKILTAVICRNETGEYLMAKWHRQPNAGLISFVHGMMHFGASVYDMAALELAEKAGLQAEAMTYRGDVYVRGKQAGETERHMLVHVFEARGVSPIEDPPLRPEVAESFWTQLDELAVEDFVPGFYEIASLVHRQPEGGIFEEIIIEAV